MHSPPEPPNTPALVTVDDWEAHARATLTPMAYDYFRSGADEEHTLRRNRDAFTAFAIWHRTLVDVTEPRVGVEVLGTRLATPILVAPTAYHRMAHEGGERASIAGTADAGSLFVASTLATTRLEDVASAAPAAPKWFQLYVHRDRAFTERLIDRAKAAGYAALAVTLDTPVLGRRIADVKNGFGLPPGLTMENLVESMPDEIKNGTGSELARYVAARHDPSFTERDLEWLVRRAAPLPVVVKGVVRGDDARRALSAGARAIWVSNHGGRQLDLGPATIEALPEVRAAVGPSAEVYVDGGIRSGTHALIALALGANAVFVGRPIVWALTVGGRDGVRTMLDNLTAELVRAMRLAGARDLEALRTGDLVRKRS
ncbi:MAG: alpha-hydroxy acid oxidase [Polyangiaceae bacterium]